MLWSEKCSWDRQHTHELRSQLWPCSSLRVKEQKKKELNVLVGSREALKAFRGCKGWMPHCGCQFAQGAVCFSGSLWNLRVCQGADKGLQAVFDCCHKFTKTDNTCPERSMMTCSTFVRFAVTKKDLWRHWSWVTSMTLKILHWFQRTQVWFSVCFRNPLLTLGRRKEFFEWY